MDEKIQHIADVPLAEASLVAVHSARAVLEPGAAPNDLAAGLAPPPALGSR